MNPTIINKIDFDNSKIVEQFVLFLMEKFSVDKSKELNIVLTNDEEIQKLNSEFRQRDTPTNVLSFYGYDGGILGDIVISMDTLKREAEEQNRELLKYLLFIVAHGFLHLLGYTHETMEKFNNMMALQNDLVKEFLSKGVEK